MKENKQKNGSKNILFSIKIIDDFSGEPLLELKMMRLKKFKRELDKFDSQISNLVLEKYK